MVTSARIVQIRWPPLLLYEGHPSRIKVVSIKNEQNLEAEPR